MQAIDRCARHPGVLVNTAGPRTQARVAWESWSTPRVIGVRRESPGRTGRLHGPSEQGQSHPGELVDPVGSRT